MPHDRNAVGHLGNAHNRDLRAVDRRHVRRPGRLRGNTRPDIREVRRVRRSDRVRQPSLPVVQDVVVGDGDEIHAGVAERDESIRRSAKVVGLRLRLASAGDRRLQVHRREVG